MLPLYIARLQRTVTALLPWIRKYKGFPLVGVQRLQKALSAF